MKKFVCIKLLTFIFLNIFFIPVMLCGKKRFKQNCMSYRRNNNKLSLKSDKYKRKIYNKELALQNIYNKKVFKKVKKLKELEKIKEEPIKIDEIFFSVIRKILDEIKHAPMVNVSGRKMSAKLALLLGFFAKEGFALCTTLHEDENIKVEKCCEGGIWTNSCRKRITDKGTGNVRYESYEANNMSYLSAEKAVVLVGMPTLTCAQAFTCCLSVIAVLATFVNVANGIYWCNRMREVEIESGSVVNELSDSISEEDNSSSSDDSKSSDFFTSTESSLV